MSEGSKVLLIDDEEHIRLSCAQTLGLGGYDVETFATPHGVLDRLSRSFDGVVVTDIKMQRLDGRALMRQILEIDPDLPVILITGHGDVTMAVEAMRDGAYDFIEKPFDPDRLVEVVGRAIEKRRLTLENRALRSELQREPGLASVLIGRSETMERLRQTIRSLADTTADVLILGETGVGKDLVARCLHEAGGPSERPFVAINCGAMPATIIESELFGHEAGAFTGAAKKRVGKFEHAQGGTVLLDEIESMPLDLQVKLLRVLQERAVERLGGNTVIPIDVRVIAATKVDLLEASRDGAFREDLYYRLNVVALKVDALREHKEDIPALFQSFVLAAAQRHRRPVPLVDNATLSSLLASDWPGNVRELKNAAERFVLGLAPLPAAGEEQRTAQANTLAGQVEAFEKSLIEQALARNKGSVKATYEELGLARKTFYDKMARHGLTRAQFVDDGEG
jgi:two-component system C4-dicarboxylate transport response regulator DctD